MKKIQVRLDWFANTNHTGFIVALKKGWYQDAGLDVSIVGEVHGCFVREDADIVVGPQPAILTGVEQGIGVTAVAVLTQKNDSGILSLAGGGITRPKDLTGKRLTHWAPAWFHSVLKKAVNDDGGDYDRLQLIAQDVPDIKQALGKVADAVWIYKNWEYFDMKHAGIPTSYFNFADINPLFDFCAPAVSASHALIEQAPGDLRAFLAATERGYIAAANDPQMGAKLLCEYAGFENLGMVQKSQEYISDLYLDDKGHWGHMAPSRWEPFADFMVQEGLLSQRRDTEYTNEFLR